MNSGRLRYVKYFILSALMALTFICAACKDTVHINNVRETIVPVEATSTPKPSQDVSEEATGAPQSSDVEIHFTDNFFHEAVCDYLGKGRYDPVYVSEVEHLKKFSARVCRISDITEISYFRELEELDLYGNTITDLSPIQTLTNLKKLNISKIFSVIDGADKTKGLNLTPIKGLILLEELDASGNMITDITALKSLTNLKTLNLENNRLTDVSALSALKNLTWLDISDNIAVSYETNDEQGIGDLLFAASLTELTYLNASNNVISSLEGLEGACKLKTLDIKYNYVQDLTPLWYSQSIVSVNASYNNIQSIRGLFGCNSLKTLHVDYNFISEIDIITYFESLEEFTCTGNPILDYSPYYLWQTRRDVKLHGKE